MDRPGVTLTSVPGVPDVPGVRTHNELRSIGGETFEPRLTAV